MKIKKSILSLILIGMVPYLSLSFCGFYVAKADTKLFNKTSQVIMVRDGLKTTVTMSNDFKGDVKDFAMVIPVPSVLKREDIKIAQASLFNKLDAYSGPRLVEYHDRNPCAPIRNYAVNESVKMSRMDMMMVPMSANLEDKEYGVTIEAQYKIDEYDILILSAKESNGLKRWLLENGYKIPSSADEVLEPYIKNNMKFFVVKVDVEKLDQINGVSNVKKYIKDVDLSKSRTLRPLQITYESSKFMLPIRLGMANSSGEQDMVVYAFTKKGRVECTNYRTTKIPTNKKIPLFIRQKFGEFYVDLFDKAHSKENKEAIFLEYAWNISPQFRGVKCDPCVGPPPIFTDLQEAGVDWAINSSNRASADVFFTRLHVRYSRNTHPQDLQFQVTPNKEHFQARYILTNTAKGDLTCDEGQTYCAKVVKNRANELEALNELTSWSTQQHAGYVQEYYDLLDDPNTLNEVEEDKNEGFIFKPSSIHPPNNGIKLVSLSIVLILMLGMFFYKRHTYKTGNI